MECGTHADLISRNGNYCTFFAAQFGAANIGRKIQP
jgi:hypothetical protein